MENWKPIAGYEGRYEVSDQGNVRSVPFMQRYLLRTGAEAFRQTKATPLATQYINSGYLIVHLHMNNKRQALLVHRLVATAFCGAPHGDVNHMNGKKDDNRAANLEWVTRTENHLHAVGIGLLPHAIRVRDPKTGVEYGSINQAAKKARHSHRKVRATFERVAR